MPLTMAGAGRQNVVRHVGGRSETRRFLESLGFIEGETVVVISELGGNLIVGIKDARIALSKSMASKIMV